MEAWRHGGIDERRDPGGSKVGLAKARQDGRDGRAGPHRGGAGCPCVDSVAGREARMATWIEYMRAGGMYHVPSYNRSRSDEVTNKQTRLMEGFRYAFRRCNCQRLHLPKAPSAVHQLA